MPLPTFIEIEELRTRLAFWRVKGVGPKLMADCLQQFSSCNTLFSEKKQLPPALHQLIKQADWRGAEHDLNWLSQPQQHLLLQGSENFPPLLAEISTAPPFIFVRGNIDCLHKTQLSIVGSRNPSYYGIKAAQLFTRKLVESGLVITSGLALGIDAICHQETIDANGQTIGVLAVGLDNIYPKRHQQLADNIIAQQGALVSEFGVGMQPIAENFPRRNRLISGLSLGVFVIEATLKSGSLITARLATEQGRDVFALPGSIFQPLAQGCHQLIKQGAKCVETVEDILFELPHFVTTPLSLEPATIKTTLTLTHEQTQLIKILNEIPQPIEDLLAQLPWPTQQLQTLLTQLILQNLVQKTWHGYVRL